jgi:hypothetical protein
VAVKRKKGVPGETGRNPNLSRNRVDYKTVLSPDEFPVFSRLREFRKELAQTEAVPVYALFTNEQLAQMVQRRCQSKSDLAQIEGPGDQGSLFRRMRAASCDHERTGQARGALAFFIGFVLAVRGQGRERRDPERARMVSVKRGDLRSGTPAGS